MSYREETLTVRDRPIRLLRAGTGQPLLYLHDTFHSTWTRVHDALAAHYESSSRCIRAVPVRLIWTTSMAWTIWCFTTWMYAPHSGWTPGPARPLAGAGSRQSGRCATRRCCVLLSWWMRLACASLKLLPRISCALMPPRCVRCCSRIPMLQWPRPHPRCASSGVPRSALPGAPDAGAFRLAVPG